MEKYQVNDCTYTDYRLPVPVDWTGQIPGNITLFAREVSKRGNENAPRLVFFQGGPGSPSPRPATPPAWVAEALKNFRVVLFDQRGTGASSPLDAEVLASYGSPEQQADVLACMRADSIVRDAEALRQELQGDQPWHVLGQSFGGFIITHYLSSNPDGLASAMVTAGLPSVTDHVDDTYRLTWASTEKRNREMFSMFEGLEDTVWDVATHLDNHDEILPSGERLTPRRLRTLGLMLGYSYGPHHIANLFEDPFVTINGTKKLNSRFLHQVGPQVSFATNPLYALVHEAIYAGTQPGATAWSAHRMRDEFENMQVPGLSGSFGSEAEARGQIPFRFSGEHIFPWLFDEDPALVPVAQAADLLARRDDLPALYDLDALASHEVPTAAWIYYDDMFVPASMSIATAERINATYFLTNDYHHDGLRANGPALLDRMVTANKNKL